jgi:hypothetical protein
LIFPLIAGPDVASIELPMLQMVAKQLCQQTHRNFPGLRRERSPPWAFRRRLEQALLVEP